MSQQVIGELTDYSKVNATTQTFTVTSPGGRTLHQIPCSNLAEIVLAGAQMNLLPYSGSAIVLRFSSVDVACDALLTLQVSRKVYVAENPSRKERLVVTAEAVMIDRTGLPWLDQVSTGRRGVKEIPIREITSVQFSPAGTLLAGFLEFSFPGGRENVRNSILSENAIGFRRPQEADFRVAKKLVDHFRNQYHRPRADNAAHTLKDLETLAELLSKGIITQDEFDAKKKQILNL